MHHSKKLKGLPNLIGLDDDTALHYLACLVDFPTNLANQLDRLGRLVEATPRDRSFDAQRESNQQ